MKNLFAGIILGAVLSSCATYAFDYVHYTLNLEKGMLQGPTPADDLPITVCKNDAEGYHCEVMLIAEFYRLKNDDQLCHAQLETAQKDCPAK